MNKNKAFHICMTFLLVTVFSSPVLAGLTVVSEYSSLLPNRSVNNVYWDFDEENLPAGGKKIEVRDRDLRLGCRAELFFDDNRFLVQADSYRIAGGEEVPSACRYDRGKPALLNHTIVPGDWLNRFLPFVFESENRDCVIYEQIGTTRFATYLEIKDVATDVNEAVSAGMIRGDMLKGLSKKNKLYVVEVKRKRGKKKDLILRQLWQEGDNFWLFEEKGGRRSWRIAKE